jgi:hypothetical protein
MNSTLNDDFKHKFYMTRLKHGLIISYLLLIPMQNMIILVLSYFQTKVSWWGADFPKCESRIRELFYVFRLTKNIFPHRESNPGHLRERQES